LDFVSPEDATAALVNPRNYQLNGRKLVLEYASPDAVRRGGGSIRPVKGKEHSRRVAPRTIRKQARDAKRSNEGEPVAAHLHSDAARPRKPPSVRPRSLPSAGRAKPGAALADAHRERVAIVQSEGKKTVF
jgi:RNA recognition motif-containing protein